MIEGAILGLPVDESRAEALPELAALVPRYSTLLYRLAYSVVRNTAEAEDVVQETFLRVAGRQERLGEIQDLRVWLTRIAWNLALDRRRRIRPEQMDEVFAAGLRAEGVSAEEALSQSARMAAVLEEMEKLPRREREALELSAMEELSTAEIAAVLKRSEASVRGLIYRARTRLKTRMARAERRSDVRARR